MPYNESSAFLHRWKRRQYEDYVNRSCFWCDNPINYTRATVDHLISTFILKQCKIVIPEEDNIVLACAKCNLERSIITSIFASIVKGKFHCKNRENKRSVMKSSKKKFEELKSDGIISKYLILYITKINDTVIKRYVIEEIICIQLSLC